MREITIKGAIEISQIFGKLKNLITLKVIFWVQRYYFANVCNDDDRKERVRCLVFLPEKKIS